MAPLLIVLELRSPEPDDVELGLSVLLLLPSLSHVIGHEGRARPLLSYALDLVGLVVLLLLVQRCVS